MRAFPVIVLGNMFTRINFLLGFGLLVAIAFYFAGNYLIVGPLSHIAPNWVKPVAGALLLAGLALMVQSLSMASTNMAGVASYTDTNGPGVLAFASQTALVCGHAGLGYLAFAFFYEGQSVSERQFLLVASLYLAGITIAVLEWRRNRVRLKKP